MRPQSSAELGLVLTGGGARGAYQVGLLRWIARKYPDLYAPILTGISAGAVNAAHIAQHPGPFGECIDDLVRLWLSLTPEKVFHADAPSLTRNVMSWAWRLLSGGMGNADQIRSLVDTEPLREFLEKSLKPKDGVLSGVEENLRNGRLKAIAVSTTSYSTGQNVVFVQGREIELWTRPMRRSVQTRLNVDHVMASAALPFIFPAVEINGEWYGDGGIRLAAPISPALHLGAQKIIAISTRYSRTMEEADVPQTEGYPPPAAVVGVLYSSIFLDLIDQDVLRLTRLNDLIRSRPEEEREGMRLVDVLVIRPSQDLAKLSREYEPRLPKAFRFLTRGLGTRKTKAPDLLSIVMFQKDYINRLIELGESDAENRSQEIEDFLSRDGAGLSVQSARADGGA